MRTVKLEITLALYVAGGPNNAIFFEFRFAGMKGGEMREIEQYVACVALDEFSLRKRNWKGEERGDLDWLYPLIQEIKQELKMGSRDEFAISFNHPESDWSSRFKVLCQGDYDRIMSMVLSVFRQAGETVSAGTGTAG